MNARNETYDVLIIGAGMSGLIASCELAQAGKKVLLLEKLSFIGGRFSAFQVGGSEISTGAFHTLPHGNQGPFAQALRRSGAKIEVSNSKIFASFHVRGQQVIAKTGFDVFKVVQRPSDKVMLLRILLQAWAQRHYPRSFGEWITKLVLRQEKMFGYRRRSLTRASLTPKRQLTVAF